MDIGGVVGRQRELSALEGALRACSAGRGSVVCVTGEAGIGKSRLLEALAASGAAAAARLAWGRTWEAGGAPSLLPWREALAALGIDWPDVDGDDAYGSFRLFEAVVAALSAAARRGDPIAVLLEDLHVADAGTIDLLRFIAPRASGARLLVVASWRDAEARLAPDIGTRLDTIPGLRLRLGPLGRADLARVLEETIAAPIDTDVADAVFEMSGGNPLHAREALSLRLTGDTGVPQVVRINTERRMRALSDDARTLLEVAAIVGRQFDVAVVGSAAGVKVDRVIELLAEARLNELIAPAGAASYRFGHALVRDAIEESLDPSLRAQHHRAVGEELERRASPAAAVARHFVAALPLVGPDIAASHAERAGDEAAAALAFEDAASHYTAALDIAAGADQGRYIALLLKRGRARLRTATHDAAKTDFRAAIERARAAGRADELAMATLGYTTTSGTGPAYGESVMPDPERQQLLRAALATRAPGDHPLTAELMARLAMELWSDVEAAAECGPLLDEAHAMATRLGSPRLEAATLLAEFLVGTYRRGPERLEAVVQRLDQLANEVDDLSIAAGASFARFYTRMARGDIDSARQVARAHAAMAERYGIPAEQWRAAAFEAALELATAELDDAARAVERAHEIGKALEGFRSDIVYLVQQAMLMRRSAVEDDMETLLALCVDAFHSSPSLASYGAGAANAYLWLGRDADARTQVQAALSIGRRLPRELNWLGMAALAGDVVGAVGDEHERAEMWQALAPWSGWVAVVGSAQDVWGPVDRALALLAAGDGDWERAEAHHRAAVDIDRRMGTWASMLLTLGSWARALSGRGRPGDAERVQSLVDEITRLAAQHGIEGWGRWWIGDLFSTGTVDRSATLRRDAGGWEVVYQGRRATIAQPRGFDALAHLVASPGREVHVLDLAGAGVDQADLGPVLDAPARRSYLERATELRDDLALAEADGDLGRIDKIRDELEFIAAELSGATGRGGRARATGSTAERARVATTKAIKAAIARITEHHPELGGHLASAVRTGAYCCYDPDPTAPVQWTVEA